MSMWDQQMAKAQIISRGRFFEGNGNFIVKVGEIEYKASQKNPTISNYIVETDVMFYSGDRGYNMGERVTYLTSTDKQSFFSNVKGVVFAGMCQVFYMAKCNGEDPGAFTEDMVVGKMVEDSYNPKEAPFKGLLLRVHTRLAPPKPDKPGEFTYVNFSAFVPATDEERALFTEVMGIAAV